MNKINTFHAIARKTTSACVVTIPSFLVKYFELEHHDILEITIKKIKQKKTRLDKTDEDEKDNKRTDTF